jgi:1-acyl-sn-glycerol-3-phosphate acyltransferase
VVPIAVDSGRLWGRGLAKRPGTVTFRIGEPIPAGLRRDEIEARVHAAINALD